MRAGTLIAVCSCLVLLAAGPGLAQIQSGPFPIQSGPFPVAPLPAAQQQSTTAGFGTFVPRSASLPVAPSTNLPSAVRERPFSNYQPPPAVSPYMNLYRFNPDVGINNYYSLVRPMLQQQGLNQQFRTSIDQQGAAIDYLGRKTEALPDIHQPGYYMRNSGNYFGFPR